MVTVQAAIAANRFGLGARPGELAEIGADHEGWLLAQLGLDTNAAADESQGSAEILRESQRLQRVSREARRNDSAQLSREVFPASASIAPLEGLIDA